LHFLLKLTLLSSCRTTSLIHSVRMANTECEKGRAGQQLAKKDPQNDTIRIDIKIPRRKVTLITITLLLNILHWSSIICLFASIYQFTSSPHDTTSIPSETMTLTSVRYYKVTSNSMHSYLLTGSCNDIVYMPSYHNIPQAEYLGAATETDCGNQENIIYCSPLCHLIMRLLASDLWLEHDHRRTSTSMHT
jgi:hypothetical protein